MLGSNEEAVLFDMIINMIAQLIVDDIRKKMVS